MELCLEVHDDDEEGCCPFCFVMGPVATKLRREKWHYWLDKFKKQGKQSINQSNKLKQQHQNPVSCRPIKYRL